MVNVVNIAENVFEGEIERLKKELEKSEKIVLGRTAEGIRVAGVF